MKTTSQKNICAILFFFTLCTANSQVTTSSTGRVSKITTDFGFHIYDGQYNRTMLKSGWSSGIGDYMYIKHGGTNSESGTYGLRISDGAGFDFGKNDFVTSFMKIMTNGNVGIGTSNPTSKLHIEGNIRAKDHIVVNKGGSYRIALNGSAHGYISGRNDAVENKFLIHSNGSSWFNGGNVGIGTTTPDSKLTVKGKVHAEEVKVDLSVPGPDYVFKEGYNLRSLEEVQDYIIKNGHLPNIPSAKEMETDGVELGIMNMKLLEKIEELTLYIIDQKKEIEKVDILRKEVKELKQLILNIKK